jgi:hypothetical protein
LFGLTVGNVLRRILKGKKDQEGLLLLEITIISSIVLTIILEVALATTLYILTDSYVIADLLSKKWVVDVELKVVDGKDSCK